MTKPNETTAQEETRSSRGESECNDGFGTNRLGTVRGKSPKYRNESLSTDDPHLSRRHRSQDDPTEERGTSLGGIISQLHELQRQHLAYVKAHEARLEKRLEENRKHQKEVIEKMKQLEENATLYLARLSQES